MLLGAILLMLIVLHGSADAQGLDAKGPEAQFLELVDLVEDPPKQLELLDAFVIQFPKYQGMGAIYAQMQELAVQLRLWDRALAAGDKLLAIDANDTQAIGLNLAAAEGKKDDALAAKWRERMQQVTPAPGGVTVTSTLHLPWVDEEPATDEITAGELASLSKPQRLRAEAILFNRAVEEKDVKRKLKLLTLLAKEFPTSQHIAEVRYLFFLAYRDSEDHGKALAAAEAILERDQTREDVLFYAAQRYFLAKRETAKTLSYMSAVQNLIGTRSKPAQIATEQWERQKKVLGLYSRWIPALIRMSQEQWAEADRLLREALPLSEGGSEMRGLILTNLGWANYKLRKIPEALGFYKDCSGINGPLGKAAEQSIASIKSEYSLQ